MRHPQAPHHGGRRHHRVHITQHHRLRAPPCRSKQRGNDTTPDHVMREISSRETLILDNELNI